MARVSSAYFLAISLTILSALSFTNSASAHDWENDSPISLTSLNKSTTYGPKALARVRAYEIANKPVSNQWVILIDDTDAYFMKLPYISKPYACVAGAGRAVFNGAKEICSIGADTFVGGGLAVGYELTKLLEKTPGLRNLDNFQNFAGDMKNGLELTIDNWRENPYSGLFKGVLNEGILSVAAKMPRAYIESSIGNLYHGIEQGDYKRVGEGAFNVLLIYKGLTSSAPFIKNAASATGEAMRSLVSTENMAALSYNGTLAYALVPVGALDSSIASALSNTALSVGQFGSNTFPIPVASVRPGRDTPPKKSIAVSTQNQLLNKTGRLRVPGIDNFGDFEGAVKFLPHMVKGKYKGIFMQITGRHAEFIFSDIMNDLYSQYYSAGAPPFYADLTIAKKGFSTITVYFKDEVPFLARESFFENLFMSEDLILDATN